MNELNKAKFISHTCLSDSEEVCGLLIIEDGEELYVPCKNIAADRAHSFIISPKDFAEAEKRGEIVGIVHCHVKGAPKPSQADLVSCETHGVPWHIYSKEMQCWYSFAPSGYTAPLVGREFRYGVLDCFTLVRDYYREELKIQIADFPRYDEQAFKSGESLYEKHMEAWGFEKVATLQKHDVVIMRFGYSVPSHAAVYVGDGMILHHMRDRLSSRDHFREVYQKTTKFFCRLKK